jgi:hypothetical protein
MQHSGTAADRLVTKGSAIRRTRRRSRRSSPSCAPTVEEIIAVMRAVGDEAGGVRFEWREQA